MCLRSRLLLTLGGIVLWLLSHVTIVVHAAYRDSTTGSGTSGTPSVAVPTGVLADDICILAAGADQETANFEAGDWPMDFVELSEVDLTLDGHSAAIGYKRLTGSDAGSYTFGTIGTAPDWVAQAWCFSGRHTTDAPTLTTATSNAGNTSPVSVNASTITATGCADLLMVSAPDVDGDGIATGHAAPTNYTEREDSENAWANLAGFSRDNVTAGATGTVTATLSLASGASGWVAWLACLRPRTPMAKALQASLLAIAVMSLGQSVVSQANVASLMLVLVVGWWHEQQGVVV